MSDGKGCDVVSLRYSRGLLISPVLYGNWKVHKAQRSFSREREEREEREVGLRDEAHCQCAACSERSYRSVKDSMEEKRKEKY